jgi:hypothetical protein
MVPKGQKNRDQSTQLVPPTAPTGMHSRLSLVYIFQGFKIIMFSRFPRIKVLGFQDVKVLSF